jgi:hypothetical protein
MTRRSAACLTCIVALLFLAAGSSVAAKARGQRNGAQASAKGEGADRSSDSLSSSSRVHLGRMVPVDEPAAIAAAGRGLQTVAGHDVRMGYLVGPPEGWYEVRQGTLSWREPQASETHHLGITVQDAADLRVVPDCKVYVSAADADGRELVSTVPLALTWGTEFYYYAANVSFPQGITSCTLYVRSEPPGFARRSKDLGGFFIRPVTACWTNVELPWGARNGGDARKPPMTGDFGEGRHPALVPTPYPGSSR